MGEEVVGNGDPEGEAVALGEDDGPQISVQPSAEPVFISIPDPEPGDSVQPSVQPVVIVGPEPGGGDEEPAPSENLEFIGEPSPGAGAGGVDESGLSSTAEPGMDADLAEDDTHALGYEHVAHAVPGRGYDVVDLDGDGQELVLLDASRSHSHYYDPGPPAKLGEITQWIWYDPVSGEELSDASTAFLIFPLGTSEVGLRVVDNFGNQHEESTTVLVRGSTREGVYCYYYDQVGADGFSITLEDNVVNGLLPIFGEELPLLSFASAAAFPDVVSGSAFQARCTFVMDTSGPEAARISVAHYGPLRMLREVPGGHVVVMEDTDWGNVTTTTVYDLPAGTHVMTVIYLRIAEQPAFLKLVDVPAQPIHDLALQLPIIHWLSPPNSTLDGGGMLNVFGSGLWNEPNVYFDGKIVLTPDPDRSTTEMLSVVVPAVKEAGTVEVTIGNKFGGSNAVNFTYAEDALVPVKFEETRLKGIDADVFKLKLITNLQYGPDHRLYLASLDSFVYSLSVDRELKVSDVCQSESFGYLRTVIGLAFNPADPELKLYASSSIFYWGTSGLEGDMLWANGQISLLKPNFNGNCLGLAGPPIITGLPVSNHDHGVNSLLFDDDGLLHFQVGAATNAGEPAENIGGIDESPLSAASLIADIYKMGFNGTIVYDSSNPGTANQIAGDVEVFAPGWRNSFDLILHSNGWLYGTDNGANAEFGNRSTSCTEAALISPYHSDDRLGKIIKGKYAGHANRNRGRTEPSQCVWRNPFEEATGNFMPPIATFESSTDGLIEYTADLFDGQLKGDIFASKYSTNDPNDNGRVYRVQLDEAGDRKGDVESLWEGSGLSIEMTPWGDMLMPRLYESEIMALKAVYSPKIDGSLISVTPFRGPAEGRNEVLVSVDGLGADAVALFAGKPCTDVREQNEWSFKCDVPAGAPGTSVQVAIQLSNGSVKKSTGGFDYRYMRV